MGPPAAIAAGFAETAAPSGRGPVGLRAAICAAVGGGAVESSGIVGPAEAGARTDGAPCGGVASTATAPEAAAAAAAVALLGVDVVPAAADGAAGAVAVAMLFAEVVGAGPGRGAAAAGAAAPAGGAAVLSRFAQEPPALGPADT